MRRGDALPAWGCAAATAVAFLLTWPIAELGFSDDWSYAFTAKQLARTGRLTYNGWAAAAIIPQVYRGAIVIKLFGFSFTALRFSTLPLAMASAALCYLLARRAGLFRHSAVFASLTISLGPIFLPLSTSFMSDVPGLMYMLLSLYALVRCGESAARSRRLSWLAIGAAAALVGGMDRQIVWIVPLAVLPYLMILRRRDGPFLAAATAAWALVLLGAVVMESWFNNQPYAVPEPPLIHSLQSVLAEPRHLCRTLVAVWLTTALLALPAMLPAGALAMQNILLRRKGPRGLAAVVPIVLVAWFLMRFPKYLEMPWLGNTLTAHGVLGWVELSGERPTMLAGWLCKAIGATEWIITAGTLADWAGSLPHSRDALLQLRRRLAAQPPAIPCMIILAVIYVAALLSRMERNLVFDRYTLLLAVFLAIGMLLWAQNAAMTARLRSLSWRVAVAALAIYAVFAVASTQEVLSLARARVEIVRLLGDAGIPATKIDAGTEQIGWTQLEQTGHMNNPNVRNPPNAYAGGDNFSPAVTPLFVIQATRYAGFSSRLAGDVDYFSLVPPFWRKAYIYRLFPQNNSGPDRR